MDKRPEMYVYLTNLSNQTLSLSFPTKIRTDRLIRQKKKLLKHSAAFCHPEDSWKKKSMEEDWAPARKAHQPVLINGSWSVKGIDNKDFLFHGENTMLCIHVDVHEKA